MPLVYGSYLNEINKRNTVKIDFSAFKNVQKNITYHILEKKRAVKRRENQNKQKKVNKKTSISSFQSSSLHKKKKPESALEKNNKH